MKCIKPIPENIWDTLIKQNGKHSPQTVYSSKRSTITKADLFFLKTYSEQYSDEALNERTSLFNLQGKPYVPKLYAYDNLSILGEWIDGYSLNGYRMLYKKTPVDFIQQYYFIKKDMLSAGFFEFDSKPFEHFIWESEYASIPKKIDYGHSLNFDPKQHKFTVEQFERELNALRARDQSEISDLRQKFLMWGVTNEELDIMLPTFLNSL